jgi:hypothetical protein
VPQFRSKIVQIEAIEFKGTPESAVEVFELFDIPGAKFLPNLYDLTVGAIRIPTLEGDMRADAGDWIIRGTEGEFYPCKPSVFKRKYEPAYPTPDPGPELRER